MSLFDIFDVAASGMQAQSLRLNVTASNLANAGSVGAGPADVYRARHPMFSSYLLPDADAPHSVGVRVLDIVESSEPLPRRHQPDHPMADAQGYVYVSDVDSIEEMVNMLSATRSFQNNVEILGTSKELLLRTLSLGQ